MWPNIMADTDLQSDILAAEEALRQALLTGAETKALHEKLASLRVAQARATAEKAEAKAQVEADAVAAYRARIAEIANRQVTDATARIASRMAGFATSTTPR